MIDQAKITVRGGHGGAGGISFVRRAALLNPPPDGGDGGDGGNVYLVATTDKNTLVDFRFRKTFEAKPGERGNVNNRTGAVGEDLILEVPVGTQVYWLDQLVIDLDTPGQQAMVAKGGRGGRGNIHLKSKTDRRPHHSEPGEDGEVKELDLQLKILADVGLIGLPNAGKSTLLSRLTAAQPKVGAYPFTTIDPNLGVMTWKGRTIVIADIPGLIAGAATGKGLGHNFLRHLERTRLLVHLTGSIDDYRTIRTELAEFDPTLLKKKEITVLSRADILTEEEVSALLAQFRSKKIRPLVLSSVTGQGLDELKDKIIANLFS